MSDLLSQSEKDEFFSVIKDLHDTFHKTQVKLLQENDGLDPFQSGGNKQDPTEKILLCRDTIPTEDEKAKGEETESGHIVDYDLYLVFNMDYLNDEGLVQNGRVTFNPESDHFEVGGEKFDVLGFNYVDTDFAGKKALCKVLLKKMEKSP